MVRTGDEKMIAMERIFVIYSYQEIGSMPCHATQHKATWGSTRGVRRQKEARRSMGQGLYWGFQGEEWTRQADMLSKFRIELTGIILAGSGLFVHTWPWGDLELLEYWLGM